MKKRLLLILFSFVSSWMFCEQFSVLYFNVWSGLSGEGLITSESYEQPGAHDFRYELLIDGLKAYQPSFAGLSELNPLPKMVKGIEDETKLIGIPFGENGGLRIGIAGLPYNLYSGSSLFGIKETAIEKSGTARLSGSFTGDMFYAGSSRKVLICRASLAGKEIFIALTNWSEGLYADETNFRLLVNQNTSGSLDDDELLEAMETSMAMQKRRISEAQGTIDYINKIAGQAPVILMGTLSCAPESEEYQLLMKAGFKDAWGGGAGATWDERTNTNIQAQDIDLYRAGASSDRVDYILYRGGGLRVLSSRLVFNHPTYSTYPSDHYGILSRFSIQ